MNEKGLGNSTKAFASWIVTHQQISRAPRNVSPSAIALTGIQAVCAADRLFLLDTVALQDRIEGAIGFDGCHALVE